MESEVKESHFSYNHLDRALKGNQHLQCAGKKTEAEF